MDSEKLRRANVLEEQIERCKENIKQAKWTQSESVAVREMHLKICSDKNVVVPETLFRIVGKLILVEHQQRLIELEKEFDSL
jgi:hypothetical protein